MEESNGADAVSPWDYNLSESIKLKYTLDIDETNPQYPNNFVKSIRMSPTGYSYIFSTEDGYIRYVSLTDVDFWGVNTDNTNLQPIKPSKTFPHTEIIYGIDWYPRYDMEVFVSSCKDIPIRLWNLSTNGTSLYNSYNDVDELLSMTSIRISRTGSLLYGGSRKPGKEITKIKDKNFGVISHIYDNESLVGLTSFNNTAYLYDPLADDWVWSTRVGKHGLHEIILTASNMLLLNERFENTIHIYDCRNLSTEITKVERVSQSQQKFEISLSPNHALFCTGDSEGSLQIYNFEGQLMYKQKLYNDAIPCACLHPYNPLLVCGTGQRHFENPIPSCCLHYQIPWKFISC